jgi:hypothetical protein
MPFESICGKRRVPWPPAGGVTPESSPSPYQPAVWSGNPVGWRELSPRGWSAGFGDGSASRRARAIGPVGISSGEGASGSSGGSSGPPLLRRRNRSLGDSCGGSDMATVINNRESSSLVRAIATLDRRNAPAGCSDHILNRHFGAFRRPIQARGPPQKGFVREMGAAEARPYERQTRPHCWP